MCDEQAPALTGLGRPLHGPLTGCPLRQVGLRCHTLRLLPLVCEDVDVPLLLGLSRLRDAGAPRGLVIHVVRQPVHVVYDLDTFQLKNDPKVASARF